MAVASCFVKHKMPLSLETLLLLRTPMIHLKEANRNTCRTQVCPSICQSTKRQEKMAVASCFLKHKMRLSLETLLLLCTPMMHLRGADRNTRRTQVFPKICQNTADMAQLPASQNRKQPYSWEQSCCFQDDDTHPRILQTHTARTMPSCIGQTRSTPAESTMTHGRTHLQARQAWHGISGSRTSRTKNITSND